MSAGSIVILSTGLVTSVGLSAAASCAAMRAKVTNPSETRFIDSTGDWITGHSVPLVQPWRGRIKLAKMAALAIADCLHEIPLREWSAIPLLLCVAERERPGRFDGIDDELFADIQSEMGTDFDSQSVIVPHGRASVATALLHSRRLIAGGSRYVLIAATDTLMGWQTLSAYERQGRLLTARNSNGFVPGEGAGALVVSADDMQSGLRVRGVGFGQETATLASDIPLRGDGMAEAIQHALQEAGCELQELDLRVTDLSGEQYYFKEASLAISRVLRARKENFDIWHPAEVIGETGAVAGVATLVLAAAACKKGYAPGPCILCHAGNDAGQRVAIVADYRVA